MADETFIEIPIDDIDVGFDADGTPITVPKTDAKPAAPVTPKPTTVARKPEPKFSDADYEAAQRRAEAAQRERDAALASARAEAEKRAKAEAARDERTIQAAHAHWARINTEAEQIDGAIALAKSEQDAAERAMQSAIDAGDAQAQAEAARRIARTESQITALEQGKSAAKQAIERTRRELESMSAAAASRPEREPDPAPVKETAPKAPQTPEDWIAQFPRKLAGWLTENKDYVTDKSKHQQFLDFANEFAQDYGQAAIQTPSFVQELQRKFGKVEEPDPVDETTRDDELSGEPEAPEVKETPRRSAPAAPVSRSSPARPSGGSSSFKLTQEQHAIAPSIYTSYDELSPEVRKKFPAYSENAARYQYHLDLKRAEQDGKFLPR